MKTTTLLCTLVVLLTAYANAQPPVDLRPDRNGAGRTLPPHLRMRNELMRSMHDRKVGSPLRTHVNTQAFKVNPFIQCQKSLGGTGEDYAQSIQQTNDGGYIVAGWSASNDGDVSGNHGGYDYWIVKLSSSGAIQWQQSLGGSGWDVANSIQQTCDGGYIVAGASYSNDGDVSGHHGGEAADYWIVKLSSTGAIQWQQSLGGSGWDVANSIQQTNDGGYSVAGTSWSNDGDVSGNHGGYGDYWIVKLKGLKSLLPTADHATSADKRTAFAKDAGKPLLHIQPNPSPTGTFTVDIGVLRNNVLISVTNSSGRQVYSKRLAAARQFSIPLNNQPKGIYFLQITYNGGKQTEKLVVQ